MSELYTITEIYHEAEKEVPVHKWDFIQMSNEQYRFYYKEVDSDRFLFYAMEETAFDSLGVRWGDQTCVECVFHGYGYFDGVRHLYMGDEQTGNEGYIYYPDPNALIEIMKEINILHRKYDIT